MFKCNQCAFQGDYKQNLKRHERNMHGNNTTPTTMNVCDNNPPPKIESNVQENNVVSPIPQLDGFTNRHVLQQSHVHDERISDLLWLWL